MSRTRAVSIASARPSSMGALDGVLDRHGRGSLVARSGSVAFLEDEIADRLSLPTPRGASGISHRNRRPHHFRLGHPQNLFGLRAPFRRKPADRSTEAMSGGGQHDSFRQPAFVEG